MRKALLAVACSVVLAACGSTVQVQSSSSALGPGSGSGGLAPGDGGLGTGPVPAASRPASAGSSTTGGGVAPAGTTGQVSPGTSGPAPAVDPVVGKPGNVPGVTATTVQLGVEYISTAQIGAFANAVGVKAVGKTDMLQAYKAAVAAVNKAGGVAGGRRLVIVPRERSTSESIAQAAQTTCDAFTYDNRVLLANSFYGQGSPAVSCLTSRGVVAIGGMTVEGGSQLDFQRFGGKYLSPGTAETISAARTYVQALVRQGFLTKSNKIGLLWFDYPDFRDAKDRGLVPALRSAGLGLAGEYRATYSGSASDVGGIASQMQSAALQFGSSGVDRVLTLDYQGTLQYFFMTSAENQRYRPKYGLASWSDAEFLRANGSAQQLAGSTGIGWMPGFDLQVRQLPVDEPKRRCLAAMKAGGVPPLEAQTDTLIQLRVCAEVFFAERLLNTATSLTPSGLAAAAAALQGQPSYSGFAERFGASKLWGAATYRDLAFDAACECYAYRGPTRPF